MRKTTIHSESRIATISVVTLTQLDNTDNIFGTGVRKGEIDIRDMQFHEVVSDIFEIRPEVRPDYLNRSRFIYIGDEDDFKQLKDRRIIIDHPDIGPVYANIIDVSEPSDKFLQGINCCGG